VILRDVGRNRFIAPLRRSSPPESGPLRAAIFAHLTKREQEHDGAEAGIGVLIRIERAADVRGKPLR
jgi:hypothetical protein